MSFKPKVVKPPEPEGFANVFTDAELLEIHALAARGLKPGEILGCLGRSPRTAKTVMDTHYDFKEAYTKGQALGVKAVANALFENATKKGNVTAQIVWLKMVAGWRDEDSPNAPPAVTQNGPTVNLIVPQVLKPDEWTAWVAQQDKMREVENKKTLIELQQDGSPVQVEDGRQET